MRHNFDYDNATNEAKLAFLEARCAYLYWLLGQKQKEYENEVQAAFESIADAIAHLQQEEAKDEPDTWELVVQEQGSALHHEHARGMALACTKHRTYMREEIPADVLASTEWLRYE